MKKAIDKSTESYKKTLDIKKPEEKIIKKKLPFKSFDLFHLGDTHIGSKMFQWEEFSETLRYILNTPNAYAILTGDLIQSINKYSHGTFEETEGADNEVLIAIGLLEEIAKKKDENGNSKVLAVIRGNHEYRNEKDGGVNPYLPINMKLDITDNYIKDTGILEIEGLDKKKFNMLLTHGSGIRGSKGDSILRDMLRLLQDYRNIHMISIGHKHRFEYIEQFLKDAIAHGNKTPHRLVRGLVAPAWLKYGEYGKFYNFSPTTLLKNYTKIRWDDSSKDPIISNVEYEDRVIQSGTKKEYEKTMKTKGKATKKYDEYVRAIEDVKTLIDDVQQNWEFLEGNSKKVKTLDESWKKNTKEQDAYERHAAKMNKKARR